ncbi:hypothetical protein KI387_016328, partial [Taxus chinensis]
MAASFERSEYEFLKELGLQPHNLGCNGKGVWKGNGNRITSVNPANNQPIATVAEASVEDYEDSMRASEEACKIWMQ